MIKVFSDKQLNNYKLTFLYSIFPLKKRGQVCQLCLYITYIVVLAGKYQSIIGYDIDDVSYNGDVY